MNEPRYPCVNGHTVDEDGFCEVWIGDDVHLVDPDDDFCDCHGLDMTEHLGTP